MLSVLLWPYLVGSEDAPATANRGDEKKVFSAASISSSRLWPLVVGIYEVTVIRNSCDLREDERSVGASRGHQVPRLTKHHVIASSFACCSRAFSLTRPHLELAHL